MPDWTEEIRRRLSTSRLSPERESEIVEEWSQHLEDLYAELRGEGASHAGALEQALAELDHDSLPSDLARAQMTGSRCVRKKRGPLDDLRQDLRYGLRVLANSPGFAATAALTLALGIGANATIFSFVNAFLIRPLALPDPHRLVVVWETEEDASRVSPSYLNLEEWRRRSVSFEAIAGMIAQSVNLTGADEPERLRGAFVSASFFDVVGERTLKGRTFRPEEGEPGGERVVVVNHGVWQSRFGGDPDFLGKTLVLNNEPYTVVGIMPPAFDFPIDEAEIWMPLHHYQSELEQVWWAVGRLRPGITLAQAQREMDVLAEQLAREFPEENQGVGVRVETLHGLLVADLKRPLLLLMAAVGIVLVIACSNLALLVLARGAARGKELALRLSLGASRLRVVRQLLTELGLLGALAAVGCLPLTLWSIQALSSIYPGSLPASAVVRLDWNVLSFFMLVTFASVLLFGLVPALRASRPALTETLKEGSHTASVPGGGAGRFLVVAQMALALVLLGGAGLLVRTTLTLRAVDVGFRPNGLLSLEYRLPRNKYPQEHQQWAFHREVLVRTHAIPGVLSAAHVRRLPFSGNQGWSQFSIPGRTDPVDLPWAFVNHVSPGAFETLGVSLLQGRVFGEQDGPGAPPRIVINRSISETYWPGENPVGKDVEFPEEGLTAPVIGVVDDVKYLTLEEEPMPQVYISYARFPSTFTTLVVRTDGDPLSLASDVRSAVWSVDPDQPVWKIRTAGSLIVRALDDRRFLMRLVTGFAVLSLVLVAVGIYGLVAYSVNRRAHEMGIRMAVGARRTDVLRMVLRQGMTLVLFGVAFGLPAGLGATRFLESLLFGVRPADPLTFAAVCVALVAVALLACYIPALRATRVDPATVLRQE